MKTRPWLPYVLPMAVYMAFLTMQSSTNLLWLYPVKVLVVAALLWWFRREYIELRPAWSWLGIAVGLLAIVFWIALDSYYWKTSEAQLAFERWISGVMKWPAPTGGLSAPFDPTTITPLLLRYGFITCRVAGAVLVVPVMEELFWRAFAIRWLVDENFQSVPVGRFTWSSFAITTVFFGLEHDQWLVGLICGALYNWLLYRTRSVWACIIAHAVSNAALAAWVLSRGDWKFW